jgi:O-antigen/teichoic acid export membrane protein
MFVPPNADRNAHSKMSTFTPESTQEPFAEQSLNHEHTQPAADLTGRDRLVSNVLLNWGAESVFIVAGFIMPRMIDRRLGQELLGVWDFSWSLVNYFGLIRAAIGSSVNRYVARYWAARDISGVNHIVSSATCILGAGGLLVMALTVAFSLLLPQLFSNRLGENIAEAQWVVFFLGVSLGVQISFSGLSGLLTGCHEWGLHNINTSGWYAATVAGMIVALLLGGRLWSLAAITFAGEVLASARRLILAHRVCKGLRLQPSLVQWQTIKKLFSFGGKTLLPSVSNLLLNQTTSILIVAYLGPAALALYSRPRSLIYHVQTLVGKMAMTLTPTISSLQSTGNLGEIRELAIKSARYSFYMAMPMVLMLIVFGSSIMQLWMGPRYADGLVPAILATGHIAVLVHWPALCILAGLNAHGRAGAARFVASVCSVGLNVLVLAYLKWGLVGTAVAVTLPLTIVNVVDIPFLICRRVGLDLKRYFLSVAVGPALHTLPFAACLVGARLVFQTNPLMGLAVGGAAGGAVLAVLYWRYVIPDQIKTRWFRSTGMGRSAA